MRRKLVMLAVTLCTGTVASRAYAHHSHPIYYDTCKRMTIERRIERVEFKDPLSTNGIIVTAKKTMVSDARVVVTGDPIRPLTEIRANFPDITDAGVNSAKGDGK